MGVFVRSCEQPQQNSAGTLSHTKNLKHPATPGLSLEKVIEWQE